MTTDLTAIPIPANGKVDEPVIAHPTGAYSVLRVLPADPFTRRLIPAYVDRCIKFIEKYHSDTDELWLGNLLYSNFSQNTNYVHALVALDQNEKITAHCLSYIEQWQKLGTHVHILQLEKDEGGADILELGSKLIEEWAISLGIKTMINSCTPGALVKLYEKRGWERHRFIMKKTLGV